MLAASGQGVCLGTRLLRRATPVFAALGILACWPGQDARSQPADLAESGLVSELEGAEVVLGADQLPKTFQEAPSLAALVRDGRLQEHLAVSAGRALSGLALGIVAGTLLAVVSGLSRWGEAVVDGPVQLKRAIPSLALIPLLILWLGIGETMKVVTILLGVLIPVYIHTHNGLRSIDARYVELAETVGLSRWDFLVRVVLPGALPGFLLGLRFAVTGCWLALVVVEQINGTAGIGYMMELARTYGQTDVIVVGLVLYGVLGYGSDLLVRLVQRRALSWRRTLAD